VSILSADNLLTKTKAEQMELGLRGFYNWVKHGRVLAEAAATVAGSVGDSTSDCPVETSSTNDIATTVSSGIYTFDYAVEAGPVFNSSCNPAAMTGFAGDSTFNFSAGDFHSISGSPMEANSLVILLWIYLWQLVIDTLEQS
jgi:hypothetical protein